MAAASKYTPEQLAHWKRLKARGMKQGSPKRGDAQVYSGHHNTWIPLEQWRSGNPALSEDQWDEIILDEETTVERAHEGWGTHGDYAYAFEDGGSLGWWGHIDGPGDYLKGRGPTERYELGPYDTYPEARNTVRRKLIELTGTTPMINPKAKAMKTYEPGELVRETANFLRSTGRVSTSRIDGVVVGAGNIGPYVVWSDDDVPVQINAANIEKKKSSMPPGQALSAARLATGLPIGKFSAEGYKIYVRNGKRWELASNIVSGDWEKQAARIHDELDRDVVVLSPDDSYVVLSMRSYTQVNPPRARGKVTARPRYNPASPCEVAAAARALKKCARWLGSDADYARGLATTAERGLLSERETKKMIKLFDKLARSDEPVIQRCLEEELLQMAVGNPNARETRRANPDGRTRALARKLARGD